MNTSYRSKRNVIRIAVAVLLVIGVLLLFLRRCTASDVPTVEYSEGLHAPEQEGRGEAVWEMDEIGVGRYYKVIVNDDTAFVCITAQEGNRVEGMVYPLEALSDRVTPRPFICISRFFNSSVEYNNSCYTFKRAGSLRSNLDGNVHLLIDKQGNIYRFQALMYMAPIVDPVEDSLYREVHYSVQVTSDILYGNAKGYWTGHEMDTSKSYVRIALDGVRNAMSYTDLPLKLDLYRPEVTDSAMPHPRPLILWLHGGAFYVNNKCEESMVAWCRHFASLGYLCASVDYRQGFLPTREGIERTAYMAVQDAHAAMRYLVHHADSYGIDTAGLFVAGASAGSITALNLVFMTERERPASSYGYGAAGRKAKKRVLQALEVRAAGDPMPNEVTAGDDNLGPIYASGNRLDDSFRIRAVANLWGAVYDVTQLRNSRTNVVSVHGDADLMVPYEKGYPFQDQTKLGKYLIGELYGSAPIHRKAQTLGLRSTLVTLPDMGHAPQFDARHNLNIPVFNLIKDTIATFFYDELVAQPAVIEHDSVAVRHYRLASPAIVDCEWEVEGGFIVQQSQRDIWVVWRSDAMAHRLCAVGRYRNGITFTVQYRHPYVLAITDNETKDSSSCRIPLAMASR